MMGNILRNICALLVEGYSPSAISKLTKVSHIKVWKIAKKYEDNGLLVRINKYPAQWKGNDRYSPTLKSGGGDIPSTYQFPTFNPAPLIPHKFGASFNMGGEVSGKDKHGIRTYKELSHTARFGKNKAVIWLKHFSGNSVKEIIGNAGKQLDDLALSYEKQLGIKLFNKRVFINDEWVVSDRPAGNLLAEVEGIPKGEQKVVLGAIWKNGDATHPNRLEINQAQGFSAEIPREQAARLDFLIQRGPEYMMGIEEYDKQIKRHLDIMNEMSASMDKLSKGIDVLNRALKKIDELKK